MNIYLNDWAEGGRDEMLRDFGINEEVLNGADIIVASYTYADYSGDAYVLFKRDDKLWEVHGGHCSCYGLSESDYYGNSTTQWQPEETTREAIIHRLNAGVWGEEAKVADAVRGALNSNSSRSVAQ